MPEPPASTGEQESPIEEISWREHLLVLLLFTVLSIAMTWPAILLFGEAINSFGDTIVQMTTLAWNAHALATNPLGLFEAPFFYPYQHTNAYSEHLLGQTILALPILWATGNPAPAANLNSLLSFVLTGWGTYVLVRDLAGSRWAAFAAAIAFTFNGFRFMQSGHLHMLSTEWFPLTLWALRRGLYLNSGCYIALTAFFFVCMALFSVYYLFFLALIVLLYMGWWLVSGRRVSRGQGTGDRGQEDHASRITHPVSRILSPLPAKLALAALVVAVCVLPLYWPYLQVNQELGFSRSFYDVQNWAARPQQFLNVLPSQWLWATLFPGMASIAGERQLFPGLIITLLALVGVVSGLLLRWRRRRAGIVPPNPNSFPSGEGANPLESDVPQPSYFPPSPRGKGLGVRATSLPSERSFYLLLGFLSLVLTFGISYRLPLLNVDIPLPYAVLYDWVPGFTALRVPVRFAVLIDLALAVLGGYGLAWLLNRRLRANVLLLALPLLGLMLLEYVQVRDLSNHRDVRPTVQELPTWIAQHPGPIIELPMTGNSEDVWYTYWATYHWQPLVNGFSSFVPPGTVRIAQRMRTFPDPAGIALLQGLEVKHVVVHLWQFPQSAQADLKKRLESTPDLRLAYQVGEDYIYELAPDDWLQEAVAQVGTDGLLMFDLGATGSQPALETLAYALRYNRLQDARLPDPAKQIVGDMALGYRSLPPVPLGQVPALIVRPASGNVESPLLSGWEQIGSNGLAEIYRRNPNLLARYDLTEQPTATAPYGLTLGASTTIKIGVGSLAINGGSADVVQGLAARTPSPFPAGEERKYVASLLGLLVPNNSPLRVGEGLGVRSIEPQSTSTLRLLIGAYTPISATLASNDGASYSLDLPVGLSAQAIGGLAPGDSLALQLPQGGSRASLLVADLLSGGGSKTPVSTAYSDTLLLEATPPTTETSNDTITALVRVVPRHSNGGQFTLTLDIYQKPYGTHPDGHFGSWSLPLPAGDDGLEYEITLNPTEKTATATLNGGGVGVFSWIGPPRAGDFAARLVITNGDKLVENLPFYDFGIRDGRLTEVQPKAGKTTFLPLGQ